MSWLNPANVQPTEHDPKVEVSGFIREFGQLGVIALGAWNAVDPFHCYYGYEHNPDEYLGYARRFVEGAIRVTPGEWSNHPDLVEELVRRSFGPTQVVHNTRLGRSWATAEDIKSISQRIAGSVEQLGGMEHLLPEG